MFEIPRGGPQTEKARRGAGDVREGKWDRGEKIRVSLDWIVIYDLCAEGGRLSC